MIIASISDSLYEITAIQNVKIVICKIAKELLHTSAYSTQLTFVFLMYSIWMLLSS